MLVALGSKNPVKLQATLRAFHFYYPDATVEGVEVESGVHHTPRDEDMVNGAFNRAKAAREKLHADFGVGLEGGLLTLYGKTLMTGYVAITDGTRSHGAYAMSWELPPQVVKAVDAGKELGDVVDELFKTTKSKHAGGSIGFFSKNAISREDAFYPAVIGALIPWASKEFY